jgi:DNA repair exonuclease SbcCD ATPase subunit
VTFSVPKARQLTEQIADRSGASIEQVENVLTVNGISLTPFSPPKRSITVSRLTFAGTKANTDNDGPFTAEFTFGAGVTALISDQNLRGKTTVLELLTWALRGSARRLRSDVEPWIERLVLEYSVNGTPLAVALTRAEDGKMRATVVTADTAGQVRTWVDALEARTARPSIRVLVSDLTEAEFADYQSSWMLDALRLEPITNWQKFPGSEQGRPTANTWPAYYGAIYLPEAGSTVLLGDVVFAGLPGRLLQLFCNVPLMSAYIKTTTLTAQARQDDSNRTRRIADDSKARTDERANVQKKLRDVQSRLQQPGSAGGEDADGLAKQLREAEKRLRAAEADLRSARALLADATAMRQGEARRQSNARETELAVVLFHGLTPRHCPRCEQKIDAHRTQLEADERRCAVCTNEVTIVPTVSDDPDGPVDEDGEDPLVALTAAETAAQATVDVLNADHATATQTVTDLSSRLDAASASARYAQRRSLELDQARLSGQLDAMPDAKLIPEDESLSARVLDATAKVLKTVTSGAARELFDDLNDEIADLGRKFGIDNLDTVAIGGNGSLKVTTAGVEDTFSKVTGGERLRLRIAVTVALLRVGHRAGAGSHPGLLLIDSPGSDELTVEDEATLLRELDSLKTELSDLQVIVASAEPEAVVGQIDSSQIHAATGNAALW